MPLASKNHRSAKMESSDGAGHALIVVLQPPVPARSSSLILVGRPSGIRPRLNSQTRVYDDSMPKLAGWSWAIVARLLTGVTVSAQTLNNQSLSGKYSFRHISLGTNSPSPASLQALTLMGSITFNGSGRYDYIGQQLIGHGAAVSRTGSGAYSLDQGGFVSLDSPLRAGAKINARFAAEAVIGSSTESTDSTFDLFVAIPAPTGGAVFAGPYNCMSLEFRGGGSSLMGSAQFPMNQSSPGILQSFTVFGQRALQHGKNRAAHNRHNQQAGTLARQRAKLFDAQREDGREHHGIEQSHRYDAAHRDASHGGHRDPDQGGSDHGGAAQPPTRRQPAQHRRADEAPHHRPAPIEGNEFRGVDFREIGDIGLGEVVHQKAADGHLRAHVHENSDRAQHQVPVLPDAAAGHHAMSFFDIRQRGQMESRNTERQHE